MHGIANRAMATFALSVIGAAYPMMSLYVAVLADRSTTPFYYTISFQSLFPSSFVVVWSASHILEDWKGRITWPSITLGVGVANLSTVLTAYYVQITPIPISSTTPSSLPAILALISGPILSMIGGILGFSAVRQYSREHGHAIIARA